MMNNNKWIIMFGKDKELRQILREGGIIERVNRFKLSFDMCTVDINRIEEKVDLILEYLELKYVPKECKKSSLEKQDDAER